MEHRKAFGATVLTRIKFRIKITGTASHALTHAPVLFQDHLNSWLYRSYTGFTIPAVTRGYSLKVLLLHTGNYDPGVRVYAVLVFVLRVTCVWKVKVP